MITNSSTTQIHEYMLSKAPPVPQLNSSQAPEEPSTNTDEGEGQTNPPNDDAMSAANELPPNPRVADRVIEEGLPQVPLNANPGPVSRQASAEQEQRQQQRPELRGQRQSDDRLLTWAAVGLTIAIMVLLLKKFLKSSGHGAVFMDES